MTETYGPSPDPSPPPARAQTPVTLPTAKLAGVSVALALVVGVGLWGVTALARPGAGRGPASGRAPGCSGRWPGLLLIQP